RRWCRGTGGATAMHCMRRRSRTSCRQNCASWDPPECCCCGRDASSLRAALPEMDARRAPPSWVAAHRGEVGIKKERMPRMRSSDGPLLPLVRDFLEHFGQICGLVLDDLVELLRRVGHTDDELRRELRLDLGRLDDLDDVAIDLLDDRTRHARRRHQAEPGIVDVI